MTAAPVPQAAPQAGNNDFDFEEEGDGVAAVTPQRRAPGLFVTNLSFVEVSIFVLNL